MRGMIDPPVYMDYNASTPVDPRVLAAMLPWLSHSPGNPSSAHLHGQRAAAAVQRARQSIARLVGVTSPCRVVLTSGATEACNLALRGVVDSGGPCHIVTTNIEHSAVGTTCRWLAKRACGLTVVPVGADGIVDANAVLSAIRPETRLVAVMAANNEIGTVQPIDQIRDGIDRINASRAPGRKVILFSDAVQALGRVAPPRADLVSVSAHKIYGQQGVGALVLASDVACEAQQQGGTQEDGMRPGTVPVALAVGMGAAADIMVAEGAQEAARVGALRDALAGMLLGALGHDAMVINGAWGGPQHAARRLPGNLNVTFVGVCPASLSEALQPYLSVSAGSACRSQKQAETSPVLAAIGGVGAAEGATVRFGLGRFTTEDEVRFAAGLVANAVRRLQGVGCTIPARE